VSELTQALGIITTKGLAPDGKGRVSWLSDRDVARWGEAASLRSAYRGAIGGDTDGRVSAFYPTSMETCSKFSFGLLSDSQCFLLLCRELPRAGSHDPALSQLGSQ